MQEVIGAQQIGVARGRDRGGEHAGAAVDFLGAVLAPDRSESNTVVMPEVASWPS